MDRTRAATLFLFLVTLLTAGCAAKEAQTAPLSPTSAQTRVAVRNNNWLDMAIYARRGSMRVRIGTVNSMGSGSLEIPRSLLASASNIRLIAEPIGSSSSYATPSLSVWPGDTVEFNIENEINLSSISIW